MRIAVAGGTGLVGALVVDEARAQGHDVVAMSRATGVDLVTGHGVAGALDGVDAVVDVANAPGIGRKASVGFFDAATRHLLAAERAAGVRHHVALSIVGIDRVPSGYYAGKAAQEELIVHGEVPWTILRATQFHEFALQLLDHAVGPFVPVPRMRCATVAACEVAGHLVRLAAAAPGGRAQEMAGPQVHDLPPLVRRVVAATGRRGVVVPVRLPGRAGAASAGGGLLPVGAAVTGTQTFDEWLAGLR